MSFTSSSNSTLIPVLKKIPILNEHIVGYSRDFDIISTYYPSFGGGNVFTPFNILSGVWLLSGVITPQASTGVITSEDCQIITIDNDGDPLILQSFNITIPSNSEAQSIPISCIIVANDLPVIKLVKCTVSCSTDTGTWNVLANTRLSLTRIA